MSKLKTAAARERGRGGRERSEDGGGKASFHRVNKLLTEREECEDMGGEGGGRQMQTGIERRGDCGRRWWEDETRGRRREGAVESGLLKTECAHEASRDVEDATEGKAGNR